MNISDQKDSTFSDFIASLNEIQDNLDTIKYRENLISMSTQKGVELKESAKDRIIQDIQQINDLMQKNKKAISDLRQKIKNLTAKGAEFEKMIARLNEEIILKNNEIAALNDKLAKLNIALEQSNIAIDTLSGKVGKQASKIKDQEDMIGKQAEELATAYYIMGTRKDLKKANIIDDKGGFIGIGKKQTLKSDVQTDLFTKINIYKVKSIPVVARKIKIVTSHPSASYEIKGDKKKVDEVVILNAKDFWSSSKYLVIILE